MRRFKAEETAEIKKQVDKMLRAEGMGACHTPFASGVLLACKKDTAITAENGDDVWLLPRIDEYLRRCAGMTWFTLIDTRSAFW
jgi:hypothetical protein